MYTLNIHVLCIILSLTLPSPIQSNTILTQWLRSNSGILNSKLQITPNGIFSKTTIPKNELLVKIPSSLLIGLPQEGTKVIYTNGTSISHKASITFINSDLSFDLSLETNNGGEVYKVDYKNVKKGNGESLECDSVRALVNEMELGSASKFASYLDHVMSSTKLPQDWSDEGKALLYEVLGNELPPYSLKTKWQECNLQLDNLIVPVTYKNVIIPFLDLFRYNNDFLTNTIFKLNPVGGVSIHSSQEIKENTEIFIPFQYCIDCKEKNLGVSTSQVFVDYGVVEVYPQRWDFRKHGIAFEIYNVDSSKYNKEKQIKWLLTGPRHNYKILKNELDRVRTLQATNTIPEWNVLNQYIHSLITALEYATSTSLCFECNADIYNFDYKTLQVIETPYQVMSFKHNPSLNDTCLYLGGIGQSRSEDVLQQCENYRPHYHEIFVHYAARFVDTVKRVVWVGGGDSMLLHEILKYDSLELVVGLEIDQTVSRKSFQYFGTNPRYDNPKVQWWYGDAAKSLLVIPKEWYGTFDLVLVDLSETVLSMSVCKKLDIMSALGLLLKPSGVLVKNDEYFNQISGVFQYTTQLEVDIPVPNPYVCILPIIIASNAIDFLQGFRKDHGVDSLWRKHYDNEMEHDIWYDYQRNEHKVMSCEEQKEVEEELLMESKSPGVIMILDAEQIDIDGVDTVLKDTLEKEGLHVIKMLTKDNQIFILVQEGYIVVRSWDDYVAFDIHLWSAFHKHNQIKQALLSAVGSKQTSSYRIVAGGLYGVSTFDEDMEQRGPKFTQPCDTEVTEPEKPGTCDANLIDYITQQTLLHMIPNDDNFRIAVVCAQQDCSSLATAQNDNRIIDVLELKPCASDMETCRKQLLRSFERFTTVEVSSQIQDTNYKIGDVVKVKLGGYGREYFGTIHYIKSDGRLDILYDSDSIEYNVQVINVQRLSQHDIEKNRNKLRAIIIDPSVDHVTALVLYDIFRIKDNRDALLGNNILFLSLSEKVTEVNWKGFMHKLHGNMYEVEDHVFYSNVSFKNEQVTLNLSLVSSGYKYVSERLKELASVIDDTTALTSDIRQIYRQELVKHTNTAERFYPSDYDTIESSKQYYTQKALARQTIFQLEQFALETRVLEEDDQVNEGDMVDVYYVNDDMWYPGTIIAKDEDGTFEVKFEDEDYDDDVSRDMIRKTFLKVSEDVLEADVISNAVKDVCSEFIAKESFEYFNIGDGSIHTVLWPEGGVVVSWDGRQHVDINLFTYSQDKQFHDEFVNKFEAKIPSLKVALSDTQPRGVGKVINFSEDVEHYEPLWIQS